MFIYKNNNLYYKDFKITKGDLSPILIIFVIIYYINYTKYIYLISYLCIYCFIYGIIETFKQVLHHKLLVFISIIAHLPLLLPLINIKDNFKPNILQIIPFFVGLLIIIFKPSWSYVTSRTTTVYSFILFYIFFNIIYYLYYKYPVF